MSMTDDPWKDHDIDPQRCGFCGAVKEKITVQGDSFVCSQCGRDWPKRVVPDKNPPMTLEQRLDRLEQIVKLHDEIIELIFTRALEGPITQFDDEEMQVILKYNQYRRDGTLT